ncbi:hypothetical protein NLX83_39595 [Allokutzneria sp. A3M-2-11 16]|uniref:hypothetical protein n=1 Tax=Allokutzneria sp. A3M-2-11 16 TaxID=2962043 RepID=UPI0020B81DE0|nr:hypothetical protein [Allokutzneria sp. A3M-2-11 16]MCP3805389.1 hypothetical protein [Allokutzneria sp. A3M-2-11 16]
MTAAPFALCVLGCADSFGQPYPAVEGTLACDICAHAVDAALRQIARDYEFLLDPRNLVPGADSSGRGNPGYGSRSPARDDLIICTDPRTTYDERAESAPAILSQWVREIVESTDMTAPERASVAGDIAWLLSRKVWRWVISQPWLDEFGGEVFELREHLAHIVRPRARAVPIGPCPVPSGVPGNTAPCGTALRVRPDAELVRCRTCGTTWPRERWDELGHALGCPRSDYASLSVWLGVPVGTLRRWCAQDGWARDPAGHSRARPVWLRTDALASFTARRHTAPDPLIAV